MPRGCSRSRSAQTAGTSAATSSGPGRTRCPRASPTGPPNPTATCSCSPSRPGISSTRKPSGSRTRPTQRGNASELGDRGERVRATDGRAGADTRRRRTLARTGRNVRSVWNIATQPYPEAHFATFPEELARRCILAGTSERGCCPECGAPWVREVESAPATPSERLADVIDDLRGKGESQPSATARPQTVARRSGQPKRSAGVPPAIHEPATRPCASLTRSWARAPSPTSPANTAGTASASTSRADYLALAARRLAQQSLFAEAT